MAATSRVSKGADLVGHELTAGVALRALHHGGWRECARAASQRFRYGDGFSHARALGLQLSLAAVPLAISCIGLSRALHTERIGAVFRNTVLALTPATSDELLKTTLSRSLASHAGDSDELALWLGLLFALFSLTTAMGQVERGANRIYGVDRDRPTRQKYGRAMLLALFAGLPAMCGVVVLVTVASFGDAVETTFGLDDDIVVAVGLPVAVTLILAAAVVALKYAPRRVQPQWSWFLVAAAVILVSVLALTALLAGYIRVSTGFNTLYGPLTSVMALLLWSQFAGAGIFYGVAFAAELEASVVKPSATAESNAPGVSACT